MEDDKNPLISIVVPIQNAEKYLEECIQSILQQRYQNIELILVDDCSTDESVRLCKKYENDKVTVLCRKYQGGVSRARNDGLRIARGKYICFVDADDFIEKDYIQRLSDAIRHNNVPVVFCHHQHLHKGRLIKRHGRINQGLYLRKDIEGYLIDDGTVTGILFGSVCGAIYDRDFLKERDIRFDEKLKKNEDGVFNIVLLMQIDRFYVLDYDGYVYRQWKNNRRSLFVPDQELDNVTKTIRNRFTEITNRNVQMCRRNVSVVFWNAISIGHCQGSAFENCRRLKDYVNKSTLRTGYAYLDKEKISFSKKILVYLLYRQQISIFFILMKYVYPAIKKIW